MANVDVPTCPVCGKPGVPILYGLPTPVAREAAAAGKVRLYGCVVPPDHDEWICPADHAWRTGDEQLLIAAIDAALARN